MSDTWRKTREEAITLQCYQALKCNILLFARVPGVNPSHRGQVGPFLFFGNHTLLVLCLGVLGESALKHNESLEVSSDSL
jgi:hypothetical protein